MVSEEKWEKDSKRVAQLTQAGYEVEIVWEKSIRSSGFL